jgi:hypothetical protein
LTTTQRLELMRWLNQARRHLPAPPLPQHELDQLEAAATDVAR